MARKWLFNALAMACMLVGLLSIDAVKLGAVSAFTEEIAVDKIEPALLGKFNLEGTADFIVQFKEQADLSPAYQMDWDTRGEFVYQTLIKTAAHSQGKAKRMLDGAGFPYMTYIAGNKLYVEQGNLDVATRLAALDEVATIYSARTYHLDPVVIKSPLSNVRWSGDLLAFNLISTVGVVDTTLAWGISDVKADQFWAAFGVQGEGIRVANIDGGVDWNHPALVDAFVCKDDPTNPACFLDAVKECDGLPCDLDGHGTHTMGTMVANNDPSLPYIAGMAPNATWIACKGCTADSSCPSRALLDCADWILAPGDDPANRPNVVNNSWGGGGGNDWYMEEVEAWRAAGIFPAFSAGNEGPDCATLGSPGDYQESFASAAHDSVRNIASFSSRGPSAFGDDPYTKPNISAPGVSVCSTVPDDAWTCGYSGTSMASPHTAGAVALLWSCNPELIGNFDATFQVLQNTTDSAPEGTCGAPADGEGNYTFGYGYLNVLAAGASACGVEVKFGTIEGYVVDNFGNLIEGATVVALPSIQSTGVDVVTDPDGYYSMDLVATTYSLTASKVNYVSETKSIEVFEGVTTTIPDFVLQYLGSWTELDPLPGCPDWMRYDGEYFPGDGMVYFLGGRINATDTDPSIYALDPNIGECVDTGVDMLEGVSNYTIVPLNISGADVLCTFGGRDIAGANINVVQCFDPVANNVSQVSTLPASLDGFAPGGAVAVDNKAYILGGLNLSVTKPPYTLSETWEWDPATDTWTRLDDMLLGMGYLQTAVVDGLVYSFGGTTYDGTNLIAEKVAYVFDPATGSWSSIANMQTPGAEGRAYGFDSDSEYELAGQIVVAGGGIWPEDTYEVFLYDIATNSYDYDFFNLNITRRDHAGVFVPGDPGTMWVFGGISSAPGYGGDDPPYGPPEYYTVEFGEPEGAGVNLSPEVASLGGDPGTVVEYIFTLENTGVMTDTFSVQSVAIWETDIPVSVVDLAPGEIANVSVMVSVPAEALSGDDDMAVITATSTVDPAVFDTSELTTIANTVHDIELTPTTMALEGNADDIVTYSLNLTNLGNIMETITLSYAGNLWDVHLPVTSLNLAVGVSVEVIVHVTIPTDAIGGTVDIVTITATAASGEVVFSVLTTSVPSEIFTLTLPIVHK